VTLSILVPARQHISLLLIGSLVGLGACQRSTAPTATAVSAPATIANPILPGDFPDPSVVQVGDTYWATATTSNWGPVFPLLKSKDLAHWELVGHVFPDGRPTWADYYFWAPEISQEGGKTYVFYTAHRRGGNLSVGVASADTPAGPYHDHGPLVGQPDGSIDAFPMRDENNQLYLIWKEDGNSVGQPTPIWAQRLNDDRTALLGEKQELFRNDSAWEAGLVEGVSIVHHAGYFYAFYAGNGCCGSGCTYATGVARARNLLGPWEKYDKNPILVNNDTWKCPGHGTVVQRDGRWFLLHHAYDGQSLQYVGRQGVLSEFTWNTAGWPEFEGRSTTVGAARTLTTHNLTDEFNKTALLPTWQWPVEHKPTFRVQDGKLRLTASPEGSGAVLGQPTYTATYTVTATLLNPAALPAGATAGLTAHGDPDNALALTASSGKVELWQRLKGQQKVLAAMPLPATNALLLRMQAEKGNQFRFSWSTDAGKTWQTPPAVATVDGAYLPPWDRGVRVGVVAQGPASAVGTFENFTLVNN